MTPEGMAASRKHPGRLATEWPAVHHQWNRQHDGDGPMTNQNTRAIMALHDSIRAPRGSPFRIRGLERSPRKESREAVHGDACPGRPGRLLPFALPVCDQRFEERRPSRRQTTATRTRVRERPVSLALGTCGTAGRWNASPLSMRQARASPIQSGDTASGESDRAGRQRLLARLEIPLFLHPPERDVHRSALQLAARHLDHLQAEHLARAPRASRRISRSVVESRGKSLIYVSNYRSYIE